MPAHSRVLSVLCIIMIGVTTVRDEWLSPLRTAVGYFLMPVQSGVNRVGKSLYNNLRDREKLQSALDDNRRLQEQIDELVMENTRLQADSFELTRLRRLYELDQNYGQYHMVGARVIAKDTGGWFHIFRIDKGSADGIRPDMNVLAGGGLIGIVTETGGHWATVRAIIDDTSAISAMASITSETCIVEGSLTSMNNGKIRFQDKEAFFSKKTFLCGRQTFILSKEILFHRSEKKLFSKRPFFRSKEELLIQRSCNSLKESLIAEKRICS